MSLAPIMNPPSDRAALDPAGLLRAIPLAPHQMTGRITPVRDAIVLCHLGVPRLAAASWSVAIDGLVASPRRLDLPALRQFPFATIEAVHQCAGNPLEPHAPTQRVCNVVWGGYRLADVLAACGPAPEARFIWSYGADWGVFEGVSIDAYAKDLPIGRAGEDVLLAVEMNGAPLRPENGFPVRLVVPGFYGTNSVKWLTRLTLATDRAAGPFTTRWYNDPVRDHAGRATGALRPVWNVAPQSVIVAPNAQTKLPPGKPAVVWGWAWADSGIAAVTIGVGGESFVEAAVEPRRSRAWQRFEASWTPERPGTVELAACATAQDGETQPADGARNAIHRVVVTVAK